MENYGLDPVHYYTVSGLSWDAQQKKSWSSQPLVAVTMVSAQLKIFHLPGSLSCGRKKRSPWWTAIRYRYIEFGTRTVSQHGEIDLPEGLWDEPLLGSFFRDFV